MKHVLYACSLVCFGWFCAPLQAGPKVVSLNPCYDAWLPQWLPADWQVLPTTEHHQRLETIISWQPDWVIAGSFSSPRLRAQLQSHAEVVVVQQPLRWQQWQQQLQQLGDALGLQQPLQQWASEQQQQLMQLRGTPERWLLLMPNFYSWGQQSWQADVLAQLDIELLHPDAVVIRQLRLEQLLRLQPDRVILEGFSERYSRGQDWLVHQAFLQFLATREVQTVSADIASCPAVRVVDYVKAMRGQAEQ